MSTRASRDYPLPRPSGDVAAEAPGACLSPDDAVALANGTSSARAWLAHIEGCERCRILVAESLRSSPWGRNETKSLGAEVPRSASGLTTFRPGDLVAERFVTRRFLARGGMGEVYLVFDRLLEEEVALKTLPCSALDNPEAVRLVKAEVQMARRIADRHVCRILDFGIHTPSSNAGEAAGSESAVPFLTMAYLRGETLGHRVRALGGLSLEAFARWGLEIARGLAAIHEAGVVHRDVKSDNVFLTKPSEGESEIAVVMDLGLAGLIHERVSSPRIMGTQGYMSPQQLAGAGERDPRDDVYSMGKVLQEIALGHVRTLEPHELRKEFSGRFGNSRAARLAAKVTAICQAGPRAARYPSVRAALTELEKLRSLLHGEAPGWHERWPVVLALSLGVSAGVVWLVGGSAVPSAPGPNARVQALSSAADLAPSGAAQTQTLPAAVSSPVAAPFVPALVDRPPEPGAVRSPRPAPLGRRKRQTPPPAAAASSTSPPSTPPPAPPRSSFESDLARPHRDTRWTTERPHPNQLYDPSRSGSSP